MDKYQKKAQGVIDDSDGTMGASLELSIAAFGRRCAAEAYEDAASIMFNATPGLPEAGAYQKINAKAAALKVAEVQP